MFGIRGNITPKEIVGKIREAEKIVMTAHVNPDGDALGSILAFYLMIKEADRTKNVEIVIDDALPKYMRHFGETDLIRRYGEAEIADSPDLFISLDCANEERYGRCAEIKRISKSSINIDHHISNTEHAQFNYIEDICSTAELLYQFLEHFNISLTSKMADFMYLGIINDTGNFKHDNVTGNTFRVCAKLMEAGADNNRIANIIFEMSPKKMNLFGDVYRNNKSDRKYGFIYYYLSQEDFRKMEIQKDETDGIAEIMLKIKGMEISLFAREEVDGAIKGSLRCNDRYNVNEIAAMFGGGGHVKAAGFRTELPLEEILEKIYTKL